MRKKFCFARRPGRVEDHIVVDEPERNVVNESLFDQPEIDFGPVCLRHFRSNVAITFVKVQAFDEAGHPALDNTLDQTLEPAHEKTFDFEEETEQVLLDPIGR